METCYKTFLDLKKETPLRGNGYPITSISKIKNHKLGVSELGKPLFFIKCNNDLKIRILDVNLEIISIQFNRKCQLINKKGKIEEDIYTIISFKSDSEYLEKYFIKIILILITNIGEKPTLKQLRIEIDKLITLFSKLSRPALKTIQGLWSELLIIERSKNPDYLIKSWHQTSTDKYDFNDGIDKIEVKSTIKNRRSHHFSLDQLNPNSTSGLIIASVLIIETGTGSNIFNLIESIEKKIENKSLISRVNEIITETLGEEFENSFETFFDYQYSSDSILFFKSSDIPTIQKSNIPPNISNVKFECDLTNIKSMKKSKTKSNLYNSLF